jgi:hypothetical protein
MATSLRLLTIADGFGDSHAVPAWYPDYIKWPEIIRWMTQGVELCNLSRYGAGNEYIVQCLQNNLADKDAVLVQWAVPNRLDLVLAHKDPNFWQDVIASDPVYNNNIVDCGDSKFWISSNSQTTAIRDYHTRYISPKQHQLRSQLYVEYAKMLLDLRGIDYRFMLVDNSKYLDVDANWICHEPFKGMSDFKHKSKYSNLDLGIVQPTPLVAFDFVKQYIMPNIDLQWRAEREINAVENMLYQHYQEAVKNKP